MPLPTPYESRQKFRHRRPGDVPQRSPRFKLDPPLRRRTGPERSLKMFRLSSSFARLRRPDATDTLGRVLDCLAARPIRRLLDRHLLERNASRSCWSAFLTSPGPQETDKMLESRETRGRTHRSRHRADGLFKQGEW
jgi:hypothetical protein